MAAFDYSVCGDATTTTCGVATNLCFMSVCMHHVSSPSAWQSGHMRHVHIVFANAAIWRTLRGELACPNIVAHIRMTRASITFMLWGRQVATSRDATSAMFVFARIFTSYRIKQKTWKNPAIRIEQKKRY